MTLEEALHYAKSGQALLFYGAGMSVDVQNHNNETLPIGSKLSKIISSQVSSEIIDDLGMSSRIFLKKKGEQELIHLLKKTFKTREVPDYYKYISDVCWKSIFTTNYDDAFEFSSKTSEFNRTPIDPLKNPTDYPPSNENIIHINGYIDDLTSESLYSSFKLTTTSYLAEQFIDTPWYNAFFAEVMSSKAIFFVGYSMSYDFDITKLFFDYNSDLVKKTFFITHCENILLEDYGTVYSKGVKSFAEELGKLPNQPINKNEREILNFQKLYQVTESSEINISEETTKFLMFGHLNESLMSQVVLKNFNDYAIKRESHIDFDFQYIFIYGDLGTGKSILAYQTGLELLRRGYDVYQLKEYFHEPFDDIDTILSANLPIAFIIDISVYDDNIINMLHYLLLGKIRKQDKVIITMRSDEYSILYEEIVFRSRLLNSKSIFEINTNELTSKDIEKFLTILNKNALLANALESMYPNDRDKKKKLILESKNQLNHLLLMILNSPVIRNKYTPIFNELLQDKDKLLILSAIFAFDLLGYSNIPRKVLADLSSQSVASFILSAEFKEDKLLKQFFTHDDKKNLVFPKSTLFAKFFFSQFINPSLLVDVLASIAKKAYVLKGDNTKNRVFPYSKVYKSLATYTHIQNMIPDKDKRASIINYYDKLKSIEQETNNPHYWLQYAIARLAYAEVKINPHLDLAKQYLDNGLALASERKGYKIFDLQTQLSRFHILHGLNSKDEDVIIDSIMKAIEYLDIVTDKDKKRASFRPLKQLAELVERNIKLLSNKDLDFLVQKFSIYVERIDSTSPNIQEEKTVRISKSGLESSIKKLKREQHARTS